MYRILQSKSTTKAITKLLCQRRISLDKLEKVLIKLSLNPFDPSLKTHKVTTRALGLKYSSRLDSDLRLIWSFDQDDCLVIWLLDIGGHSGNRSVY